MNAHQVLIKNTKYNLQEAAHKLIQITKDYNFTISSKTISSNAVMSFNCLDPIRSKIVTNNHSKYLGNLVSCRNELGIE